MDADAKSKGQLFLDLESDQVDVGHEVINKAMEGDGQALFSIGYIYDIKKLEYAKALEWYLLSAKANHPGAQNNIGNMYYMGSGMPVDYLLALEWYLKAAGQKNKFAFENIGRIFEKGLGVRDDKYMALEWYRRNKHTAGAAMKLKDKGYHVPPHKKNKKVDQLIREAEAIIKEEKLKKRSMPNEEYKPLPELVAPTERQVKTQSYKSNSLEDEFRSLFSLSTSGYDKDSYKLVDKITLLKQEKELLEHQAMTNNQAMTSLEKENQALKQANKTLEKQLKIYDSVNVETLTKLLETKSNEIELLKQNMQLLLDQEKQRSSRLEKENRKLKRQLSDSTRNSFDDDDPNNDINYDSEVESHGSDNDINYDTPVEEEDNNDLNYDSDEQTSNSNNKKTVAA